MRRLRRELAAARRELARQRARPVVPADGHDAVLGRLAGLVAHEVNNPLEAIKIYIEPLLARVEDRPAVAQGLRVIDQQVDRIARLVRSLLGCVRQRTLKRRQVVPADIVADMVELFRPRFAKLGKHLELGPGAGRNPGALDVDALQQVLINLFENALAMAPARGRVRVAVDDRDAGWLGVRVEDDGPGIAGDPEALFRPFTSDRPGGTGLGLTVSRRLCEAHGGTLVASNRPGGGAVFAVRLRLDGGDAPAEVRP